jgi:hypothetical protein
MNPPVHLIYANKNELEGIFQGLFFEFVPNWYYILWFEYEMCSSDSCIGGLLPVDRLLENDWNMRALTS